VINCDEVRRENRMYCNEKMGGIILNLHRLKEGVEEE